MSLKAKLEAVIYAAEEPVTLAQLAVLFAEEAFAWKAARAVESAPVLEFTGSVEPFPEPTPEPEAQPEPAASEAEAERGPVESATEESAGEPSPAEAADAELDARRIQRQREREVREILRGILDELIAEYAADGRGIEIREIAGGFRFGTKPEMHDAVRAFVKSLKPPMKLSLPALETLAVIAYKQPVTAPEVGEIRGVDSAGVLGSLMSRKLIATAGRKQVIGRPMLYKTTKEFLLRFGLKDLNELPSMEEFEKMAALELSEESLDGEPSGPVEQTGDLFPETESKEPEEPAEASDEFVPETSTSTAEPSYEAAEANAIVERQAEIEVEQ